MRLRAARRRTLTTFAALVLLAPALGSADDRPRYPDLLLITVDTLRADHLSSAGYPRATSPNLDRLVAGGFQFTSALTVEPLTNPSMASLLTSLPPHEHGATRNGLPVRKGLVSLPHLLARRGYATGAFVGNWTLKPHLSGLDEHWQTYSAIVSRKRWFGLFKDEARGRDVTDAALRWLDRQLATEPHRPFFLWVHYVEPHAPYQMHREFAARLGIDPESATKRDRYDSEIAVVDAEIGRLLAELDSRPAKRDRLTVFLADHGEAFGEDGEHGHGRQLHAPTLRVPFAVVSPGLVPVGSSAARVSTLDVAPTILGMFGLPVHPYFRGRDLAPLLRGDPLADASLCLQAHRGAVQSVQRAERARRAGLLEVGLLQPGGLEVVQAASGQVVWRPFDSVEATRLVPGAATHAPSPALTSCVEEIDAGLERADRFTPQQLDAESLEQLRALGYLD